jgi:2-C-methyl-D-erythritol 4-phosphate cytidylyltransferase/2-C-methyl-D-erythritol 2,4-cyclodiphosphate synthase
MEVSDTIKKVSGNQVIENIDRERLAAAQTPQGFVTEVLRESLAVSATMFTDDAAAVLSAGYKIVTVEGDVKSLKITHPSDLATETFIGIGIDSHAFSDAGQLKLGLLEIPELPALEGHSDGDVVSHAIVDSLLSAARMGDIGSNFGIDRPELAGASGEVFLSATLDLLASAGYSVVNVSVQVMADRPKISPMRAEMEQVLSQLLRAPVSIAATTTDGLGFLSDSRGIGAVSTALIKSHG